MTRWIVRGVGLALALVAALSLVPNVLYADPPLRGSRFKTSDRRDFHNAPQYQASSPGYTLHYSFSSDPNDNTYVASFTPDVEQIIAWGTITADGGADEEQFAIEIQFIAPDGSPVESEWYGEDTGTVTTYPEEQQSFGPENVARRFINVAGTPNAELTGQWTVNYTVGGKLISSGNFTLEDATDISQSEAAGNAQEALTDAGYEVIEFTELEGKSGNLFAYTIMLPVSQDLYSSETTQQIVDGLAALRQTFPNSETLYVFLRYDPRYEVAYFADAPDVDAYLQTNDFDAFAPNISVDVYDNQEGAYLGKSSKDFITKNFGAGNYQNPPNPPLAKKSNTIGSIRVTVSPTTLPADGVSKAVVSIEVFDKRNNPLPNAEVAFELSGSGEGIIRPRVTSTDEAGQADAVFTAGKKNGSVTITATSGGVSGSGVITIGSGSTDQAQDNVIAYLSAQGLTATRAGYIDAQKTSAGVIIDLGSSFDLNQLSAPIIYGMTALRINYPDATTLAVMIPYQGNYLIFPASTSDYDALGEALGAAQDQSAKQSAFNTFLSKVYADAVYVDKNGNQISSFKDFFNKNFTGG